LLPYLRSGQDARTTPGFKMDEVYFAVSGSGEILYIGRTAALCRRWISHHRFKQLAEPAKFQYLTLLNGVIYETHWLTWCEEAIKLLS
jgi:Virulence activator alpha C-term